MTTSQRKIGVAIAAYGVVLISLIFFILPMLWIIYCSFRTQPSIFSGVILAPLKEFTLENYKTILSVTDYPIYFLNSFKIAFLVALLTLVCSITGAYGLSRYKIRWENRHYFGHIFNPDVSPSAADHSDVSDCLFAAPVGYSGGGGHRPANFGFALFNLDAERLLR